MSEQLTAREAVALMAAGMYASPPTETQMKDGIERAESFLAAHDREVKAEAWEEGVRHGEACDGGLACDPRTANPYRIESQGTPDERRRER